MNHRTVCLLVMALALAACGKAIFHGYLQQGQACYEQGDYACAYEKWYVLAQQGDAVAQFNLGKLYFLGYGVRQDIDKALDRYRKAADLGYAPAQNRFEIIHYLRQDNDLMQFMQVMHPEVEWQLLTRFCAGEGTTGHPDGRCDENRISFVQMSHSFRLLAEQGQPAARLGIGFLHEFAGDHAQAAQWYRRAAEQGYAETQYRLGLLYEKGEGVEQDDAQATQWYRRAAEQGHAEAQYRLGLLYGEGKGVEQDDAQAAQWYRRAAEQGHAEAQYLLGLLYGEGKGVEQDYAQAAQWYRRAAEQGSAGAQNNLGVLYDNGEGVEQDHAQAVQWYRLAAEQGSAKAQNNLGISYRKGEGVEQDDAQARHWFRLARKRR